MLVVDDSSFFEAQLPHIAVGPGCQSFYGLVVVPQLLLAHPLSQVGKPLGLVELDGSCEVLEGVEVVLLLEVQLSPVHQAIVVLGVQHQSLIEYFDCLVELGESLVGQSDDQVQTALVAPVHLDSLQERLHSRAELVVVDEGHPQQVVALNRSPVHFDVPPEEVDGSRVLVALVELLGLLEGRVLVVDGAGPALVEAGLDRGVVVLR